MSRFGRIVILVALVFAAGAGVWPRLWAESEYQNHYVYLAHAFLHGRLDIDEPFADVAVYQGKYYVVFPPFPALLITPLVAVFGDQTRTSVVSLALTAVNFLVLRGLLRKLGIERELTRWLLAGFFLGTAYTTSHFRAYESWHFAHIVAVTCLLVAAYEALGRGRGWVVGLGCGLAFLSRHLCIYAVIFLAVALWYRRRGTGALRQIVNGLGFAVPLGLCLGAYLLLNWLRFGDPLDTGYAYMPLSGVLHDRVAKFGLFHPAYVPFNLVYLLLQGPHIQFAPPTYLSAEGMDLFGTSLLFGSPVVLLAVLARWSRPLLWAGWISIVLPIVHGAFYYNNGFAQTNAQRFTLDFWPILIVLVALGASRVKAHWWKAAIGYAIALNVTALFLVWWLQRLTASL